MRESEREREREAVTDVLRLVRGSREPSLERVVCRERASEKASIRVIVDPLLSCRERHQTQREKEKEREIDRKRERGERERERRERERQADRQTADR